MGGQNLQTGPRSVDADDEEELLGEEQDVSEEDEGDDEEGAPEVPPDPAGSQTRVPRHSRLAPRNRAELLRDFNPDLATHGEQGEALAAAGGQTDDSMSRAKLEILQRRENANRCIVYREYPEEHRGKTIKGRVRQFSAPFTIHEIEEWVATYRGGGKFKLQFYDGAGNFVTSTPLDVEGDPKLPGEVEEAEAAARAIGGDTGGGDRAAALERQLAEERFERRMAEERARSEAMFQELSRQNQESMRQIAEALRGHEEQPKQNMGELLIGLAPIATQYLQSQQERAAAEREAAAAQRVAQAEAARQQLELMMNMQEKAEKRMASVLEKLGEKKETLTDVIKSVAEVKKLTGGENTEAKAFNKIMDVALPKLIDATTRIQLHKAGVHDGEEEEFGPKMVMDRLTGMASEFFASRGDQGGRPMIGQMQPQQPQGHLPQAGMGAPVAPARQTHAGTGQQILTPEQQAQLDAAERAQREALAAAEAQGQQLSPQQLEQIGAMAAQQQAAQQQQAQPPDGTTVDPNQVTHGPPQQTTPEINIEVFARALTYLNEGKSGYDLAEDLMDEEEERFKKDPNSPHLYIAPKVLQFIHQSDPDLVLNILNPHIKARPEYHALLDAIGQSFMRDFLQYFRDLGDDDEDDDDGDDDDDSNDTETPPAQPSPSGAEAITGGMTNQEGAQQS